MAPAHNPAHFTDVTLRVDGTDHTVHIDNRITLRDLLREHLGVTAPKKGCGHGQCGSCTVLLDGRRATHLPRLRRRARRRGDRHRRRPRRAHNLPVMVPIPGTSRVDHLEPNVAAAGIELADEEFRAIDAATVGT